MQFQAVVCSGYYIYRSISYCEVLAYIPGKREEFDNKDYSKTIYPSVLEKKPAKYAIIERCIKISKPLVVEKTRGIAYG